MSTFLIDSGHSGFIGGKYLTAPHKMFQHGSEVFYEGVWNRRIKQKLLARLWDKGIHAIDLCPTELDVPLHTRVQVADSYHSFYENCIRLSIHSNASPEHNASGNEVFTYGRSKRSQGIGNILGELMEKNFDVPFRKGDGQYCKTSDFYILKHSDCPAVLPEFLFYDYYEDYKKLIDPQVQQRYVDTLVSFIEKCELTDV